MIAPAKVNGNSKARAGCDAISADFFGPDDCEELSSCLLSEGIFSEPRERLRIQPGGEGDKHGDAEGHGLRAGHGRARCFARRLEPSVNDDAEVVVEGGYDVENGEDGEDGMVRFDERKENEILAHEAGGGRDARKGRHEEEQEECGGGGVVAETGHVVKLSRD